MKVQKINAKTFKNLFLAGAKLLEIKKEYVNELNVFPVPDGDTGTNMTMTILSAAKEVELADENSMAAIAKAISSGSLRGARGNSGVILSQLLRGFAKGVQEHKELDAMIIAEALSRGVETAYKAVMKPKEGTILTVAKGIADKAAEVALENDDILENFKKILEHGKKVLENTPNQLPVLKEAGVVDAGGQGLYYILKGAFKALENGGEVTFDFGEQTKTTVGVKAEFNNVFQEATDSIEFGYCTEFIINTKAGANNEKDSEELKAYLETIGDSIVAVCDDDLIKIHVHTENPGLALQKGLTLGYLSNLKIENMRIQHTEQVIKHNHEVAEQQAEEAMPAEKKENGFVAVSAGTGIEAVFKGLGVDVVITGGQTMNPSTDDFVQAIQKINADTVFLFPNNKNIILAAEQAVHLVKDRKVIVIPSKTIPQGIGALISFEEGISAEENKDLMVEAMAQVKSGQVTYAVRDTQLEGKNIETGDIIAIGESKILSVAKDVDTAVKELIAELMGEDGEIITLYHGEEVSPEDAQKVADDLAASYPEADVELQYGGQPLYYYLISVE
ncbi:DAK2 domain-containing protein [Clostridiales bacterium COT073_COT-073]|nr:DAK2 domain-containing protein [Clostridiales bacterium COT073_COT-073]